MRGKWRFHSAGEIIFGRGAVQRTGEVARRLGAARLLLVTDEALIEAGLHEPVEQSLAEATLGITRLIRANPRALDGEALEDILGRAW